MIARLHRYQIWWRSLDVKVRVGFYVILALVILVGLPAGTAEVVHSLNGKEAGDAPADTETAGFNSATSGESVDAASDGVGIADGASSSNFSNPMDSQETVRVYNQQSGVVQSVPLNVYVENVLAAQVSPTAPMDVLEATAVVIRSYALHAVQNPAVQSAPAKAHHADVTTSGATDLAWLTDAQQQSAFKNQYNSDVTRLQTAVSLTDGIILTYQQQPIVAFLTGESSGATRSASSSFGKNLPYLTSVKCPDDAKNPAVTQTAFTPAQLAKDLGLSQSSVKVSSFRITKKDPQGYALQINTGARTFSGQDFAARLGLPSSHLTLQADGSGTEAILHITAEGRGAGFGMSIHQAVVWARQGRTWQALLHTFYPGAQINPVIG